MNIKDYTLQGPPADWAVEDFHGHGLTLNDGMAMAVDSTITGVMLFVVVFACFLLVYGAAVAARIHVPHMASYVVGMVDDRKKMQKK